MYFDQNLRIIINHLQVHFQYHYHYHHFFSIIHMQFNQNFNHIQQNQLKTSSFDHYYLYHYL